MLAALSAAAVAAPRNPALPVAIARCRSYDEDLYAVMAGMFDQLGGLGRRVRNKTVTVKLNLTGSPANRVEGRPPGVTHYSHPRTVLALMALLERAGARRIRLVEGAYGTNAPLEEFLLDAGWNVRQLKSAAKNVEFLNTNVRGAARHYRRFRVPRGGTIFPAYELHPTYHDTDVFVSMAKLKEHETCGITLTMKNVFGITPISIYGDDAGTDEPNESPTKGRVAVCHDGKRQPARAALPEIDPQSPRDPYHRMPRITAELCAARPVDIALIDGVETVAGGEGPWISGLRRVRPGVLLAGFNPVCTDAVGAYVMGFDPRQRFERCDNHLVLAERLGLGSAEMSRIEVRGLTPDEARFPFRA